MSENKTVISTWLPSEAAALVIVCAPTNLIWTVQAGGIACRHPEVEGWIFPLIRNNWDLDNYQKFVKDFDDCRWGCFGNSAEEPLSTFHTSYANAVDKFVNEIAEDTLPKVSLKFDYERIEELMEGWWPVLIKFYCWYTEKYSSEFKGYVHLGNCD